MRGKGTGPCDSVSAFVSGGTNIRKNKACFGDARIVHSRPDDLQQECGNAQWEYFGRAEHVLVWKATMFSVCGYHFTFSSSIGVPSRTFSLVDV